MHTCIYMHIYVYLHLGTCESISMSIRMINKDKAWKEKGNEEESGGSHHHPSAEHVKDYLAGQARVCEGWKSGGVWVTSQPQPSRIQEIHHDWVEPSFWIMYERNLIHTFLISDTECIKTFALRSCPHL